MAPNTDNSAIYFWRYAINLGLGLFEGRYLNDKGDSIRFSRHSYER